MAITPQSLAMMAHPPAAPVPAPTDGAHMGGAAPVSDVEQCADACDGLVQALKQAKAAADKALSAYQMLDEGDAASEKNLAAMAQTLAQHIEQATDCCEACEELMQAGAEEHDDATAGGAPAPKGPPKAPPGK